MPNLPRHRPAYLPKQEPRTPSGDQGFYQSRQWRNVRQWHIRAEPLCAVCSKECMSHRAGVVDHIVAISAGGSRTHPENLWTLCIECHKWKTSMEQHHTLSVVGLGEDGDMIPPQSERQRIKQLINEKIKYA